jgi:SAM-dependent methyltransferase
MASAPTDPFRGAMLEIAEAIAPTWERRRAEVEDVSRPVREWMLREARPAAGEAVLELAAGVGETGFRAAAMIGEHGLLITSDISPAMLEAARRRGAELGVTNVEYRVIDAERTELDADSVDVVLCRFGYMLMADPGAALAESRRVLRPGGRLALAVWGPLEGNPFFGIAAGALVRRGRLAPPEPPPAPGIFSMAEPRRTEALLAGAGFRQFRTEEVPVRFEIPDAREYVDVVADTAGPLGLAVQALPAGERTALTAEAAEQLAPFASGDGYHVPGLALCAVAR